MCEYVEDDNLFGEITSLSENRCAYLNTTSNIRKFNKARASIAKGYINKVGNKEDLFGKYLGDLRRLCTYSVPKGVNRFTEEEIKFIEGIIANVSKTNIVSDNYTDIMKQETRAGVLPDLSKEFLPVIKETLVKYGKEFERLSKGIYNTNLYVEIDVLGKETLDKNCVNRMLEPYRNFIKEYKGLDDVVNLTTKETGYMYIMDCEDIVVGLLEKRVTEEQLQDFYLYMTDLCKSFLGDKL
ncbi:hypothetical protein UT300012_21780 [Paraclostridium bifermentans]